MTASFDADAGVALAPLEAGREAERLHDLLHDTERGALVLLHHRTRALLSVKNRTPGRVIGRCASFWALM